ncbi:glycerophosphodiester phosphodiesterase family protein [Nocardioides sp. P5_C9_2]
MTCDLQAHRGGAGLWPENTLEAFGRALALGVSTLELDVHLTADDDVVVSHDPALADARLIRTLTRADLPPSMPLLRQVAALLAERGADPVRVNLEIKYDALAAADPTSRADVVDVVVEAIRIDGLVGRTSIQCFDWGALRLVGDVEPLLARNLLVSPRYLKGSADGPSPWFDGLEVQEHFVRTAAAQGFDAISPMHGSPFAAGVDDPAYVPFATAGLVAEAHEVGLRVVPYVVDDPPTMRALLDAGVDGLITNRPDVLRTVLAGLGRSLPAAFPRP